MLRRILMRRAYNNGRWELARSHARMLLDRPRERMLARSVMVRSFWNEAKFADLLACSEGWDDAISLEYRSLAQDRVEGANTPKTLTSFKKGKYERLREEQPSPSQTREWNEEQPHQNFWQEGQRVWFRYPEGHVFWDMPATYDLEATHPSLLHLAAEVLLYPWHKEVRSPFPSIRPMGQRCSLSFSAGTDSTAAALVMPSDTLLGYHRRSFASMLDHRNADRLINHLHGSGEREVVQIESNHELIRTHHDKPVGFSSDFACAVHLILLADHHDLGAIGFGMPIDNTYLWKGRKFRAFEETTYYTYWTQRFGQAGLDLLFPIASISEAGALMVVKGSSWLEHLNSCMRGDGTKGCGRCWKCFHKNGPLGRDFDPKAPEITTFLNTKPLRTAQHALWALQVQQLDHLAPHLDVHLQSDLSWWVEAYPPGLALIDAPWRATVEARTDAMLKRMPQPYPLESVHIDTSV